MGMSKKIVIKHILVALDTSRHSLAALEAAASLAKSLEAELQGIFVEDIKWFNLGQISLSYEISDLTGTIKRLDDEEIERQVRAQSARLQKLMDTIGKRGNLKYTFRSVRGGVEKELLTATESADLITIGRVGWSHKKLSELGRTAKIIIEETDKPVLILQHGWHIGNTTVVIYDGTESGERALIVAEQLAFKQNNKLMVILSTSKSEEEGKLKEAVYGILHKSAVQVQMQMMKADKITTLKRIVKNEKGGLLIVPKHHELFGEKNLEELLSRIPCPLLLFN